MVVLHTTEMVLTPRYSWVADYFGPIPECENNDHTYTGAITFTDVASRLLIAVPVEAFNAETACECLRSRIIANFGIPHTIRVDGGSHFKSVFAAECKKLNIELVVSPALHSQTQGVSERQHRTIADKLKAYTNGAPDKNWASYLADVVYDINTSRNTSTGFAPFEVMFGTKGATPLTSEFGIEEIQDPTSLAAHRDAIVELAHVSSIIAATKSKTYYDSKRKPPPVFKPNDTVLLYVTSRPDKLTSYYRGVYYIVQQVKGNPNFYEIGWKDNDAAPIKDNQIVSVQRLVKYDMSRSSLAQEELWRIGNRYRIVKRVTGHFYDNVAKVLFVFVEWSDGDTGQADIRDIRHNDMFIEYAAQKKIKKSWITRQVTLANQHDKEKGPDDDDSVIDLITTPDNDETPEVTLLRTRARKVSSLTTAPKGEVVEDGIVPPNGRLFKVGDAVFTKSNHKAYVFSLEPARGGKWYYRIQFDGHREPLNNVTAEDDLVKDVLSNQAVTTLRSGRKVNHVVQH